MAHYVYDLEVFHNFFSVVFIDIDTPQEHIEEYIEADIRKDKPAKARALAKIKAVIFLIWEGQNDVRKLKRFIDKSKDQMFISYNGLEYDDIIIDYIFTTDLSNQPTSVVNESLKKLNDNIINYDGWSFRKDYHVRYSRRYVSVDLYKLNYLDKSRISLKQVEIALKWHKVQEYKMPPVTPDEMDMFYQDMVYPKEKRIEDSFGDGEPRVYTPEPKDPNDLISFERWVLPEHIYDIVDYDINDTLATHALFNYSKVELRQRMKAMDNYGAGDYSDSRSRLADKIMSKAYSMRTGYRWQHFIRSRTYRDIVPFRQIISPMVKFETPEFIAFLEKMKGYVVDCINDDEFEETVHFRGTTYTIAKGGLHSVDKPQRFDSNEQYKLKDVDATSYYPFGIINMQVVPAHVSLSFLDIMSEYTNIRVKAKKAGNKDEADILKIVINSIFGKMGSEKSWLYDLQAMYTVTINLQLFLLMLVELLEIQGIHVISANTDGLVAKVPVDKLDLYYKICKVWGEYLSFGVEYTHYDTYARTGVNSYIAIEENGDLKLKGEFVDKKPINMGYKAPIIAQTLQAYYKDGVNIEKYIRGRNSPKDIYDFCISIKVGGQFETVETGITDGKATERILQKNNRYYVSKNSTIIRKRRKATGKFTSILKGYNLTVLNDFYYVPEFTDYNINYNWYIARVTETINRINREVHKKKTKVENTGRLFDDID